MKRCVTFEVDKDLRDVLGLFCTYVIPPSSDRFIEGYMSILLYSFVADKATEISTEVGEAWESLVGEYLGRTDNEEKVFDAGMFVIQGFKIRYEYYDAWKEDLLDLIPRYNRYAPDEIFTVEFTNWRRYVKVW